MKEPDLNKVDEIINNYIDEEGILIQLLLDLQSEFNWISKEAISRVSERLRIPQSQIYRIASFYKAMSLHPMGKHIIQVCMGTACKVRGAQKILDLTESKVKIREDKTALDIVFSLKKVNCLGCCAMGPVIVVDKDYYGNVSSEEVNEILMEYD